MSNDDSIDILINGSKIERVSYIKVAKNVGILIKLSPY